MTQFQASYSTSVANSAIEHLFSKLSVCLKNKEVANLAPRSTSKEYEHTVQSFVYQNFTEKYNSLDTLTMEADPSPVEKDNMGAGTVEIVSPNKRKLSKDVLFGERSRSIISDISKKSRRSSNQALDSKSSKINTEKSNVKEKKESFFISLGYEQQVQEPEIIKIRKIHSERVAEDERVKKLGRQQQQRARASLAAREKWINDRKKDKNIGFTFDYEGSFYDISPGKIQGSTVRTINQKYGNLELHSKELRKIEPTAVEHEKSPRDFSKTKSNLSKDRPQFSQKSFSIAQALGDPSHIAEGVKITELRNQGDSVTLEHKKKKLEGMRNYRLTDYKKMTKEEGFKEYQLMTPKKNSMFELSQTPEGVNTIDVKAMTSLKVDRDIRRTRGKSEQERRAADTQILLSNALGRGLPFIRTKGLRFNDLGTLTNTFRTLEPNSTSHRSSKYRNKIRIDDNILFQQTFMG